MAVRSARDGPAERLLQRRELLLGPLRRAPSPPPLAHAPPRLPGLAVAGRVIAAVLIVGRRRRRRRGARDRVVNEEGAAHTVDGEGQAVGLVHEWQAKELL
jgi:hypothetical protein